MKDNCKTDCHEILKFQSCILILNSGLKIFIRLCKDCLYGVLPLQFGYLIFKSSKYSTALKLNEKGKYPKHTCVFLHGLLCAFFSRPRSQVIYSGYIFDSLSVYYKAEMPNLKWLNEKINFFLLPCHEYAIIISLFLLHSFISIA